LLTSQSFDKSHQIFNEIYDKTLVAEQLEVKFAEQLQLIAGHLELIAVYFEDFKVEMIRDTFISISCIKRSRL